MRILVVDDAQFMRTILKNVLSSLGYNVVGEAKNVNEALALYKELKPDVVTMDITMPEISGIEGVKMIKDYDNNAKVIMCSAMGQQAMVVDAMRNGAIDFIVKPFKRERVEEAMWRVKQKYMLSN